MTLGLDPEKAASALHLWFSDLRSTLDKTVFAVGASEPHRRAAALNVVTRHVALLEAAVTEPQPVAEVVQTAWILAGATRTLCVDLERNQWLSAAQNVARLDAQVAGVASAWVGDVVTIFRDQFFEALRQAGVTRHSTILGPADRNTALGLSVNWGLRYLIAAAAGLAGYDVTDPAAKQIVAAVAS